MSVAIYLPTETKIEDWRRMLGDLMPDWEFHSLHSVPDPETVEYCVVWRPQTGSMGQFPNLKAIVSIGAGIDHVLEDEELPDVPIIRTVGTDLTQRMKEYVLLHVLRHHRDMPTIQAAQARSEWKPVVVPPAPQRRVGVMGLGNLGAEAAACLAAVGFDVAGWSRSGKTIDGVRTYAGAAEFGAFLDGTEILVNLLPLTDETRGILNADLFNRMTRGGAVINAARGAHMVDEDLLEALASGQLAAATLDVFHIEPLPSEHPFWTHPQITITPHIASMIDAPTGSRIIARNLRTFQDKGSVADLADAGRGY